MIKNLGIMFNNIAKTNEKKIAIQFSESEKYSYDDLDLISEQIIIFFKSLNLKMNDKIIIESKKNIYTYAMIVASLKMGISYTFVDMQEASNRTKKIVQKVKPTKVFLFEKGMRLTNSFLLSRIILGKISNIIVEKKYKIKNFSRQAYIMFTSGSTGSPKGVKISHFNLFFLINWAKKTFNINNKDVMTNINPLHFDNSIFDFYCSLFNGATLTPIQKHEIFNFKNLIKKMNLLQCSIWFSVPSVLNIALKINRGNIFKKTKIKTFIFGGEPFPTNSVRKIYKFLRKPIFFNVSGPTECTCMCSAHLVKKSELFKEQNISVGKISNYFQYKIKIFDKKKNTGELYLEGPAVSEGYINDNLKTKEKFYKYKKYYGYRTGDLVNEGRNKLIKIIGRSDNQIKFLGHRIEIEEIENNIKEVYKLSQSLIILKSKKLFPFKKLILLTDNKKISHEDLLIKLPKYLPRYMIPEEVKKIKNFKLNKNGKIDRQFYVKNF